MRDGGAEEAAEEADARAETAHALALIDGAEDPDAVEVIDGYIVRLSDGEVVGLAETPGVFRVTDREKADWVLRKLAECDAAALAVEVQRRAINDRLDALRRAIESRAKYLHFRFDADLAEVARLELAGGKGKTLTLPHGTLSFRSSKGTNTITDMDAAVAFVEGFVPSRVKVTKTVTTTAALEMWSKWRETDDPETPEWIESSGPRETFRIDTGIGSAGPSRASSSSKSIGT